MKHAATAARRFLGNGFYWLAGLLFLFLAKAKHHLQGYRTPRTFPTDQLSRAVDYDIAVVDNWLALLEKYTICPTDLRGKTILELGPGADLGVGLYLLSKGARAYSAVDVNDLVKSAPPAFYDRLFEKIAQTESKADIASLRTAALLNGHGPDRRLKYVFDPGFRIDEHFDRDSVDLVFSQAAFEHFTDVPDVIARVSTLAKAGGIFVAEIDLKTHSRWIKDRDPNNIYRYSDGIYIRFWFPGAPNRLRVRNYQRILEQNGWTNVRVFPRQILSETECRRSLAYLYPRYRDPESDMTILSCVLCATKS